MADEMQSEIDTGKPVGNEFPNQEIETNDIIQIVPTHKWGGCLAVVDEPKSFGCVAYVTVPDAVSSGRAYIRLNWDEFEKIGVKAIFVLDE